MTYCPGCTDANPRSDQACSCPEGDTAQAWLMVGALRRIAERQRA